MLLELEIDNFALVERLAVPFAGGLNVLTGETGAGKSILLDALDYLLGGSHPNSRPKPSSPSRVSGHFSPSARSLEWLQEQGYAEGDELLIARESSPQGRTSSRINGRLATAAQLRELGDRLVEIHGQHQSTQLLRPSVHLRLLDSFCGAAHSLQLHYYREVYGELREVERRLSELEQQERGRAREEEWLRHELREIEEARLVEGEDEELEASLRRLQGLEELQSKVAQVVDLLRGDRAVHDQLSSARRTLQGLVRLDEAVAPLAAELEQAEIQVGETLHGLQAYLASCDRDPQQLERLMQRRETLRDLRRKYGPDIASILNYAGEVSAKLARLESLSSDQEELKARAAQLQQRRAELAETLRLEREKQAVLLENAAAHELRQLQLDKAKFVVSLRATAPGPQGDQEVEFHFSANPGSPPGPLAKVASGGELSRMLLALLVLLDRQSPIPTLVFDEVDSGLGGRAAEAVAEKLRQVAAGRQVLCVTHLPVIAAAGDHHLRVVKNVQGDTTLLQVAPLEGNQREEEVARMLSGDATPKAARSHARELLRKRLRASN